MHWIAGIVEVGVKGVAWSVGVVVSRFFVLMGFRNGTRSECRRSRGIDISLCEYVESVVDRR